MTEPADEAFLARWSRRKAADRRGPPALAGEPAEDAATTPDGAAPEPVALPDLATLDGSSDYHPFMQAGVPPELRRGALRTLWRTNPIINSLDGLDDYYVTQDFTDSATVVANLRTIYQVGKGMLDAVARLDPEVATADGENRSTEPARLGIATEAEVETIMTDAAPSVPERTAEPS